MESTPVEATMETAATANAARALVAPVAVPEIVVPAADEAMEEADAMEDGEVEDDEEESNDDSEEDEDENVGGATAPAPPRADVSLVDADGRPLSDFEVAARYAAIEIQSMSSQFSAAVVDPAKSAAAPILPGLGNGLSTFPAGANDDDDDDEDSDDEPVVPPAESSGSDNSDDEDNDGDNEDDDPQKLRAEIEAAMEREENKASGPLKTVNEVAAMPVREPEVELTPDCPIARCGVILNFNRPGLIVTIKSNANSKPLDEGSVLCFEDRTVLGCVDEVFGPVLMPMYLVRFEKEDKIPAQTDLNKVVYYATQHTTYIIPENIRDKGTDASNIFDEETDEPVYSDDEAEAAAKRQNKKRNRAGDRGQASTHHGQGTNGSRPFTDYQPGGPRGGGGGGHGRGRGGRGGSHQGDYQQQHQVPFQTQSHGGYTRYTTPGYQPQGPAPYPPAPYPAGGQYGAPTQYAPPPPYAPAPPVPMYGQPQYGAPPHYPPQNPPAPYYGQPPHQHYARPPMQQPPAQYGPPPGYYQQPDPHGYPHHGHHPPPPPPGYGPPRGRR